MRIQDFGSRGEVVTAIGAILASILTVIGCVSPPIAFEEGSLAVEEAAHVEGVVDRALFSTKLVRLEEIDGDLEIGNWNYSRRYVLLAPGEYVITVSYSLIVKKPGLVAVAINAGDARRNDHTRRNLKLSVEGGFTYYIHFSDSPVRYLVNRVQTADYEGRPDWLAPWGAIECLPAQGASHSDPLVCSFPESAVH